MMDTESLEQGSGYWLQARTGIVTCSRLNDLMAKLKGGAAAKARIDYLTEKIVERVTGQAATHFVTTAMQRGTDLEPHARLAYEAKAGEIVDQCGLVMHPSVRCFGGSPDGLIGRDGLIEIKTVAARERYIEIVMRKDYECYANQIQGLLACTGRAWCDLIVYDDRFGDRGLHVVRVDRDSERIAAIESEVEKFVDELESSYALAEEALAA